MASEPIAGRLGTGNAISLKGFKSDHTWERQQASAGKVRSSFHPPWNLGSSHDPTFSYFPPFLDELLVKGRIVLLDGLIGYIFGSLTETFGFRISRGRCTLDQRQIALDAGHFALV
jgi:hypothetical protein